MIKTVLLIDYDPNSIGRIRRLLGRIGVRMELAMDGRSGLKEMRRIRPDVTILHDLLPLLGGLDVCSEIKHAEDCADLPVVILTGPRQHLTLMKTDCDAYIEKPYQDQELLEVVVELLKRSTETAPSADATVSRETAPATGEPGAIPMPELTEADLDACLDEVLVFAQL